MHTPLFYVGQKVVCVDGDFTILHAQNPGITVPVEGQVYTVRRNLQFTHAVGILLSEITNECIPGSKIEPNFVQTRFRVALPADLLVEEVSEALTA